MSVAVMHRDYAMQRRYTAPFVEQYRLVIDKLNNRNSLPLSQHHLNLIREKLDTYIAIIRGDDYLRSEYLNTFFIHNKTWRKLRNRRGKIK